MKRAEAAKLLHGIYAIVNEGSPDAVMLTEAILRGGARIVQYRAKRGIVAEHARALRALTRAAGALFILNDDWRAVPTYDADGVHLGPDDALPAGLAEIRAALPECVIGVSCGTPEEARVVSAHDVEYIGVGSVYATQSKTDAGEPIGIHGLRAVAAATRLPVAAIGGVGVEHVLEVRATGVAMAAVISAISGSADPAQATQALVRAWNREP